MAGLWEPSAGVFWSTPLTVPAEGWSLLAVIVCALIITIAGAVTVRIVRKSKEPGWHLRQHMVELGGAATVIYLAILVALTWGRAGTLLTMPLNEVGDFLAGAFGPVAFLWLVLGFLQQGDELRQGTEALKLQAAELKNSVEQQSIMAAAATQQIEAQREALGHQLDEKDRALRVNFTVKVSTATGLPERMTNFVNVTTIGVTAYGVEVSFEPPFPEWSGGYLGDIRADTTAQFSITIRPEDRYREGILLVAYDDAEGNRRAVSFTYTLGDDCILFAKQRFVRI
ncbi:hypothetical protein [Pseudomonas sp. AP-1]|uniref:hypothetical protein n=1 Tax=Pseudomonas sp. AP-1 TaxID=3231718 RepID=UPI0035AFA844